MTTTFQALKKKLRAELWPAGEARSLRPSHDAAFIQALETLQNDVICLQRNNSSIVKYCSTYIDCAMSMFDAPVGLIRRVYTVANGNWCDKVFYSPASIDQLRCWMNAVREFTAPLNVGRPTLPMGIKFAESSSDSVCGRARIGKWAQHHGRLYIAPWIQSNEIVVVEWDGAKTVWSEDDVIDQDVWTPSTENAIKLFVAHQHEIFFGENPAKAQGLEKQWNSALADEIYYCDQRLKVPEETACEESRILTAAEIEDDAVPDAATYTVGVIGNYGQDGTPLEDVAAMLVGKSPGIIVTTGNNTFDSNLTANILDHFTSYIDQADITKNKFFPAWGVKDWDLNSLADCLAFFKLPNNERFYSVVHGPMHFFIIDSDSRDPDGGYVNASTLTEASIMGQYIKALAALSTAEWKIAVMFDSPKSSDSLFTPGALWMGWDFKAMGMNLVLSGRGGTYEHIVLNGLDFIVNGIGGGPLGSFGTPIAGSQTRYNANYGAQILTATCDELEAELFDRTGTLIHTVTLTK